MIYLFSGDDTKKKLENYEKFLAGLPKEAERLFINRKDFNESQIESFYSGAGLFTSASVLIFRDVLEDEEIQDFILSKLALLAESPNHFIFLEGKLRKGATDAFKKAGATLNIYELPKEKKEKFDNFLVANAFAKKDKLNTWIYFRQAVDIGVSLEELSGVLFWKIKDTILKKNFTLFTENELKNFIIQLSYILPEARQSRADAESTLEEFLLEAF